jgi:alpha-beta hydrolase superfamily lysophospholipase
VPALLLHGGADPLCPARGSEAFFASLPQGSAPPSAIHIYPGLLHEIFNEPEQKEIFEQMLGWLEALSADKSQASGES